MGGSQPKPPDQYQTLGWEYRVDMRQDICVGPVDAIEEIQVDETTVWTGNVTSDQQITVNAHEIFGGIEKEGGVSGDIDVIMGTDTQLPNTYMQGKVGALCSAYRNVAAFVLKQFYVGNSTYTKPWRTKVKRIQNTFDGQSRWMSSIAEIGSGQMNPAHIIYEVITDKYYGLGRPSTEIGDSFAYAAQYLYDEGFGLSYVFDAAGEQLQGLISDVLSTIDGSVFIDPRTGKFEIALARGDYDVETIPEILADDISEYSDFKRPSASTSGNKIVLSYTDHQTGKPKTVSVADTAAFTSRGTIVTKNLEYGSIATEELALNIATRECKRLGARGFSMRLTGLSTLGQFNPMDVFKLTYPELGINEKVCRVMEVDRGTIKDQTASLLVVEDIFALGSGEITGIVPGQGVSASNQPQDVTSYILTEIPYYILARDIFTEAGMEDEVAETGGVWILAEEPTTDSDSYLVQEGLISGETEILRATTKLFSVVAVTTEAIASTQNQESVVLGVVNGDMSEVVPGLAQIGNELIWVTSYDSITNTVTFDRGVLDTIPEAHSINDKFFFIGSRYGTAYGTYDSSSTIYIKMLTGTPLGRLDEADATERSIVIDHRYLRPYRPRGYSSEWDLTNDPAGELRINWKHASRFEDVSAIPLTHSDSSTSLPVGVTYELKITKRYDDATPDEIITETGLTSETYLLLEAPGPFADHYDVELKSVRDGYYSLTTWTETKSRI